MTSEERHDARYKRRKARRDAKRRKVLEAHGTITRLSAGMLCRGPPNKPQKV